MRPILKLHSPKELAGFINEHAEVFLSYMYIPVSIMQDQGIKFVFIPVFCLLPIFSYFLRVLLGALKQFQIFHSNNFKYLK